MKIYYDDKDDLLYLRFVSNGKNIRNVEVAENIILDLDEDNKIIGIEILNASENIKLSELLPIIYEKAV